MVDVAKVLRDLGCYEISLGDTIGVGTPLKARQLLRAVVGHVPMANLAMHFHDHVIRFGNLPMYSTEIGESSHRSQIKEGYHHSNRNNYVNQILGYYGRHQALHMRQENLKTLLHENEILDNDLLVIVSTPTKEKHHSPPRRHLNT